MVKSKSLVGWFVSLLLVTANHGHAKIIEIPIQSTKHVQNRQEQELIDIFENHLPNKQTEQSESIFLSDDDSLPNTISLQEQSLDKKITNYKDIQYYGSMYMGSESEAMTVIFDTGSSVYWVPVKACDDECHNAKLYNSGKSNTYQQTSTRQTSLVYGSGSVKGYQSVDRVCMNNPDVVDTDLDQCVDSFSWLSVVYMNSGLSAMKADGIIGLAPGEYYGNKAPPTDEALFVNQLYNEGIIDQRVFSFYITDQLHQSMFTVGGYDMKYAQNQNDTITWNMIVRSNSNHWTVKLSGFALGSKQMNLKTSYAIIDSGSSYNLLPNADFVQLLAVWQEKLYCGRDNYGYYVCGCNESTYRSVFEPITVSIGSNSYTLPPSSYVTRYGSQCYLLFTISDTINSSGSFWILGANFMQNYYAVFDMEQQRVGLVGSVTDFDSATTFEEIMSYIGIILMTFAIMMIIYVRGCRKDQMPQITIQQNQGPRLPSMEQLLENQSQLARYNQEVQAQQQQQYAQQQVDEEQNLAQRNNESDRYHAPQSSSSSSSQQQRHQPPQNV